MKIINIILLLVGGLVLVACDRFGKIEDGKMTRNGTLFYPLCERSKGRVTDMRSMSFDLPELFKQAPCSGGWPDYVYRSYDDSLGVSIPSVVTRGTLIAIGLGGHSMRFSPGIWYLEKEQKWQHTLGRKEETAAFSPEFFLEKRTYGHSVIEYGFVDVWSGGRCGRILLGSDRSLDYMNQVEYYCWPYSSGNKRQMPFYISAQQSIPKKKEGVLPKSDFTDLDNQLIKPVLDSLVFNPYSDEALQFMADDHARICREHSDIFFNKTENRIWGDFPDRRSVILSMRDCGYDIPLPKNRIDSYDEIFEKTRDEILGYYNLTSFIPKEYQPVEIRYPHGGRLSHKTIIQRKAENSDYSLPIPLGGEPWYVYKISREKFSRIKKKLLTLDVLKETETVTRRVANPEQKSSFWSTRIDYIDISYEAWYYAPPEYERTYERSNYSYRAGFGFRYDQELNANVIDINFDDPQTTSTYRFVTLMEGD